MAARFKNIRATRKSVHDVPHIIFQYAHERRAHTIVIRRIILNFDIKTIHVSSDLF